METSKLHPLVPKLWDNYDIILGENGHPKEADTLCDGYCAAIAKGYHTYCHIFLFGRVHLPNI